MIAASTRTSIDLLAEHALEHLVAADKRGEDIRPHVVAVHAKFAVSAAERWHLHCHPGSALESKSAHLAELALREQLNAIAKVNLDAFGKTDRALDRRCAAAVRQAFHDRVRELRAGWSS